jgi:pimeloyl-ACP methyl ester carboxylesterase
MAKLTYFIFIILIFSSSLYAKTIVFLHGGPGLNSEPERNMLGPYLKNLGHEGYFWNEPSEQRPEEVFYHEISFQRANESADRYIQDLCEEKKENGLACEVTLVAHSFAVHHAVRLALSQKEVIKEIILISPALNIKDVDINLLQLAVGGLKDEGQFETSHELAQMIPSLNEAFDSKKIQAFALGSKYAGLFLNYWSDHALMQRYFSYMIGNFSFDIKGMFEVRATMPLVKADPFEQIEIPTRVYFGEIDPVTKVHEQISNLDKYFSHLEVSVLSGIRHYPHLEAMEKIEY